MRKLVGLFAGAAILVAACGGTSPTPAPSTAPAAPPTGGGEPAGLGRAVRRRARGRGRPVQHRPTRPRKGRPVARHHRRLAGSHPVQPVLPGPGHRGQRRLARLAQPADDHQRLPVRPAARGRSDPDHRQRRRHGRRGRRRDDRHLEAPRRPEVVRRPAASPATTSSTRGSGSSTRTTSGVVTAGWEDITNFECAVRHRHDLALQGRLRGLPDPRGRAAAAPLPQGLPVADQVKGEGFRPERSRSSRSRGPFKFESVTPQAELRLARNDNYANPRTGKPANLDAVDLQVVRRPGRDDRRLPGRRDRRRVRPPGLRHPEGPGPRRAGRAIPALLYEFLRPNWSPATTSTRRQGTGGCSRNAAVQDRGTGCPAADPAIREAIAYAIDKNEINTRLLGGNAQVANTNISPAAWFYADQPPATFDPEKAKQILADGGWADSMATASSRRTAPRPRSSSAPRPARSARTPSRYQLLAEGGRHRQRDQPGRAVGHLRRLQRGHRSTPRASFPAATSTSLSTRSARRSTRWATTSATTAASSGPTAPTTPRSRTPTSTRRLTTSRTTWTSR